MLVAAAPAKKKTAASSTSLSLVRHFGGIALVPLAVLDSTIIPTFGSLDLLTAWLAVGDPELWWYYALMSSAGSLIGAVLIGQLQQELTVRISSAVNLLIVGVLLVGFVIIAPNGLIGLWQRLFRKR